MEHPFFQKRNSQALLLKKEITYTLIHVSTHYNLQPSFTLLLLQSNALTNMNVFNLDSNVAIESDSFNEAGNLFRRRGAIYENALSEKYPSDVALGTSNRKGSSEVLKPVTT